MQLFSLKLQCHSHNSDQYKDYDDDDDDDDDHDDDDDDDDAGSFAIPAQHWHGAAALKAGGHQPEGK